MTVPDAPPATGSGHASRALGWSFTNTAASRLGTLAIGVVLARVLGPEAFGTYAIAYIALIAVLSFNELGVSLAIVRWPGHPREIAPTVSTIALATSVLIAAGTYLAAPAFATAMGDPGAAGLVQLLGLCVVVNGAVATPAALLQRSFRQDRRMVIDQVNVWVGALVSVGLALAGLGALGLVIGRLAGAVLSGVLFVVFSPEPFRFGFDRRHVRALLSFGLPLAGASIVVFAAGYVDQLVVGKVLGPVALGFYVLAFNLSSWPVSMFSQPLRSVAPALFARLQHDPEEMREALTRILHPLAAVALPACLVLAAASEDVVTFVYGPQWSPAADALRWLALLAAARILVELAYDFLVVLGRSRALLVVQVVWLVALLPAVTWGAQRSGIAGAAQAQVAVALVIVLPLYLVLLRRAGVRGVVVGRRVAVPLLASLALGAAVAAFGRAMPSLLGGLAVAAALSVLAVAGLLLLSRDDLRSLRATAGGLG